MKGKEHPGIALTALATMGCSGLTIAQSEPSSFGSAQNSNFDKAYTKANLFVAESWLIHQTVASFAERLAADEPPRLYLPEDESRPGPCDLVVRMGYRSEAERVADWIGIHDLGQAIDATTDHVLLVLPGNMRGTSG